MTSSSSSSSSSNPLAPNPNIDGDGGNDPMVTNQTNAIAQLTVSSPSTPLMPRSSNVESSNPTGYTSLFDYRPNTFRPSSLDHLEPGIASL